MLSSVIEYSLEPADDVIDFGAADTPETVKQELQSLYQEHGTGAVYNGILDKIGELPSGDGGQVARQTVYDGILLFLSLHNRAEIAKGPRSLEFGRRVLARLNEVDQSSQMGIKLERVMFLLLQAGLFEEADIQQAVKDGVISEQKANDISRHAFSSLKHPDKDNNIGVLARLRLSMLETAAIADRVTLNLQLEGFLEMADEESSVDGWGGRKTSDEQGSETFDLETSSPFAGRDDKVKYGDNDSEDSSDGELTFCERVYVCLYGIDPEMRSSWQKFNAYLGFQTERTGWLDTAGRAVALGLMIATAGLLYGVISLGYYFFSERSVNMLELGIDRVVAENKKRVEKQIRQFRLEADNMARDTWISVYNPDTGEYQSSKGDDDGKYKSSEGNVNVFDV